MCEFVLALESDGSRRHEIVCWGSGWNRSGDPVVSSQNAVDGLAGSDCGLNST